MDASNRMARKLRKTADSQEDEPISCPSSRCLQSSGQMVESIADADDDEDMERRRRLTKGKSGET